MTVSQIDMIVHELIHGLLMKATDEKSKAYEEGHFNRSMVKHQAVINAIKHKIKPGLFKEYTEKFTPEMLKIYFKKLYYQQLEDEKKEIELKYK